MKCLLDTQLVIGWMAGTRWAEAARGIVESAEAVHVSSVSIWEIAIKVAKGKLTVDVEALASRLVQDGFLPLPVSWAHAQSVRLLPPIHADPFDRMLVAQAMAEPLRLLTTDRLLARYSDLVTVV